MRYLPQILMMTALLVGHLTSESRAADHDSVYKVFGAEPVDANYELRLIDASGNTRVCGEFDTHSEAFRWWQLLTEKGLEAAIHYVAADPAKLDWVYMETFDRRHEAEAFAQDIEEKFGWFTCLSPAGVTPTSNHPSIKAPMQP